MKKSLLISDSEKYGPSSPQTALSPVGAGKKAKEQKSAPTIDLIGPQVDAFCTCSLNVGDTGTATVHYTVKSVSDGEPYGGGVPSKGESRKKVCLSITHVEAEGKGDDDEEEPEDETDTQDKDTAPPEADDDEEPETAAGDGEEDDADEDEEGEQDAAKKAKPGKQPKPKKAVSVEETGLDET